MRPVILFQFLISLSNAALADDLKFFQGVWELKGSKNGVSFRVVKTIVGDRETVEVYSNGVLTQKHHVDFELQTFGPAKVFVWRNGRIVSGAKTGEKLPDGRFIYRINNETLVGVHGMLSDDRTPIVKEVYRRVADARSTKSDRRNNSKRDRGVEPCS